MAKYIRKRDRKVEALDLSGREVGTDAGNICPMCKAGIMTVHGGCITCNNCNAQLKCGL